MKPCQFLVMSFILMSLSVISCKKATSDNLQVELLPVSFNPIDVPENYVGNWKLFQRSVNSQVPGIKGEVLQGDRLGFTQTIELRNDSSFTKTITGSDAQTVSGVYKIVKWSNITNINLEYPQGTSFGVKQCCGNHEGLSFSSNGMMFGNGWVACDGPYSYVYIKDK